MRDTCPTAFLTRFDINASLDFVSNKGALLLFGAACLRRVWGRLDDDSHGDAVDATEAYARHRINPLTLLEAWTRADAATGCNLWAANAYNCWCGGCEPAEFDIHPRCRALLAVPSQFAVNAACRARTLAVNPSLEAAAQRLLYSDIIGPPFWKPDGLGDARQDRHVREMVAGLDRTREIDPLGMLALGDALEEAGCTNKEMLEHCRGGGPHVRGCWVIEELSGRSAARLPVDEEPPKKKRPAPLIKMKRGIVRPPARG